MTHYLEVKLNTRNIGLSIVNYFFNFHVTRRFNNLSKHFIRGVLTVLNNLEYDDAKYSTDVDVSQWKLSPTHLDCGTNWDDLLFYIHADECYDEDKFNITVDSKNQHPLELRGERWKKYIQSKNISGIKRYTAKIDNLELINVIHFSNIDYLSGIISASRWITSDFTRIVDVYDNFKLCKIGYIFHSDDIDRASLMHRKDFTDIIGEINECLTTGICNIIYEYCQNICNWSQQPNEYCLTECGNNERCIYHRGLVKDKSRLIRRVVLTPF
jgi:hypothetical protein